MAEALPGGGPVDQGGVVVRLGDPLEAREEDDHLVADLGPDGDGDDREEREARVPEPVRAAEAEQVEAAIREQLLTRDDRLVRAWLAARGGPLDERLARTLVECLPAEYKVGHRDLEILADLTRLEALAKSNAPQFCLRRSQHGDGVKLVLYGWEKLSLSRLMPIFANLRVQVEEEETYELTLPERPVLPGDIIQLRQRRSQP